MLPPEVTDGTVLEREESGEVGLGPIFYIFGLDLNYYNILLIEH